MIIDQINKRWQGPGGCGQLLRIAFPLILSTAAHTVQLFVDSVFLMHSSSEEMAAASLAGLIGFTICSVFFGIAGYVNTFVAQYSGANQLKRVGPAVWQGIYFALGAGLIVWTIIPLGPTLFTWAQHDPAIKIHEITYFRIMCFGAPVMLLNTTIGTFFTGRGKTLTVMWANFLGVAINIALDYCLIFGHFGFPRWGIAGAGYATVIAGVVSAGVMMVLFFVKRNRLQYATLSGWRIDIGIFRRLLRYGGPSGIHFFLEITAFSIFMIFIGRIDKIALEATAVTFRINMLAFLPLIGLGIAITTLTGQALGSEKPAIAKRTAWSGITLATMYTSIMATCYYFFPDVFLSLFTPKDPSTLAHFNNDIAPLARQLLCFIAIYTIFDGGNIVFSAVLKGAGDTRFVMIVCVTLSWLLMVLPPYLAIKYQWGPHGGLHVSWGFLTAYIATVSFVFLGRFLHGKWQTMRVIETQSPPNISVLPDAPLSEI